MNKTLEEAKKNYAAFTPEMRAGFHNACLAGAGFVVYLVYVGVSDSWHKAMRQTFGAVLFITAIITMGWIALKAGRLLGQKFGDFVFVLLFFGGAAGVIWFIIANWGK